MTRRFRMNGKHVNTVEVEECSEAKKYLSELERWSLSRQEKQMDADRLVYIAAALAKAGRHLENGDADDEYWPPLEKEYRKRFADFVELLQNDRDLPLVSALRDEHHFTGEELEIALIVAAASIGVMDRIDNIDELQALFPSFRRPRLQTARLLLPEGRLIMSGLMQVEESRSFRHSDIAVDPQFVEAVLRGKGTFSPAWNCDTQEDLLKKLPMLRHSGVETFPSAI